MLKVSTIVPIDEKVKEDFRDGYQLDHQRQREECCLDSIESDDDEAVEDTKWCDVM